MKAWRFYALSDMRLDDIPYPHPAPGWVTIKTRVVQPSVTEAIRAKGGATTGVEAIKRRIETEAPVQLFGHEFCGEVAELGEGVTSVQVGDRVVARAKVPCHECALCRSGRADRCRRGPTIGVQIHAGFCEFFTIPAEVLTIVPPSVSDLEAATLQPLGSCVADVSDAGIQTGDTVAILGQGVIGLSVLQLAKLHGAGKVIGVDVRKSNLDFSKQFGSDYQIDASQADSVEAVREITRGMGADVVFECAGGSPAEGLAGHKTLIQAMEMAADGGKVVQVALISGAFQFDPALPRLKCIRYIFPLGVTSRQMDYAVHLLATGQVKVKPIVSHVLEGLERAPEAFEITANKVKYDAINPAQVVISR